MVSRIKGGEMNEQQEEQRIYKIAKRAIEWFTGESDLGKYDEELWDLVMQELKEIK